MTPRDRLDDLLLRAATEDLTVTEAEELDALLARFPGADAEAYALAAAALDPVLSRSHPPLPESLQRKLNRAAVRFARGELPAPEPAPAPPPAGRGPRRAWVPWAGWGVAAGLAVAVAALAWPKPAPTVAQQRDEFVRRTAPVTFAGESDTRAAASVVWSAAEQTGFLEVRGLPANDPARESYQLWIVDPAQKHPVDAAVFDVRPDGTALVKLRPPIRVSEVKALAITKEVAGGVVVTSAPMLVVLTPKAG